MRVPAFARVLLALLVALALSACGGGDWFWDGGGGDDGGGASSDASLFDLAPVQGELSPAFAPGTPAYVLTVGLTVDAVSLVPRATDPNAAVTVDGLPVGYGAGSPSRALDTGVPIAIDVRVVAVDGVTERHYAVVAVRPPLAGNGYLKRTEESVETRHLGQSVAVSGNVIFVGSPDQDAVHVFERADDSWTAAGRLVGSNTEAGDGFGASLSVSGDTLVVGAPFEDGSGRGVDPEDDENAPNAGAAYVFVRDGSAWSQQALLKAGNSGFGDQFGSSVSVDGDTVAVGAPYESGEGEGIDPPDDDDVEWAGAAYVFVRQSGAWSAQAYVKSSAPQAHVLFGYSVAVSGDRLAVGSPFDFEVLVNENSQVVGIAYMGDAYLYARTSGVWSFDERIRMPDWVGGERFGTAVALSGDTLVVGAPGEEHVGAGVDPAAVGEEDEQGAAFVFVHGGGGWTRQAYLKAAWPSDYLRFGYSVAISGNVVVVGAPDEDGGGTGVDSPGGSWSPEAGAAYVFVRREGSWAFESYLKATHTGAGDEFGIAVAVDGGTFVVGAWGEDGGGVGADPPDDDLLGDAGAAYVFR
jgi:hypothetical protein